MLDSRSLVTTLRRALLRALCTTELGGLGFLRTEPTRPHNSGTPCRTACHTFRTALKSPSERKSNRTNGVAPLDYVAEPAPGFIEAACRRESLLELSLSLSLPLGQLFRALYFFLFHR